MTASAAAGVILLAMSALRRQLGIDLDPDTLRPLVQSFGALGPLVFIALTAGRIFLGLPSQLLMVVGGLCFGTVLGTLYGGIGLITSGLATFAAARWTGREAVEARIPEALRPLFDKAGGPLGALFIFVGTAYPIGFISAYNAIAGVTALPLLRFSIALSGGSLVRAGIFARFGDSLMAGELEPVLYASGVIVAVAVVPLLFPASRRWIREMLQR